MMDKPLMQATETWRRAFHAFNPFMLLMWRLGLGPAMNMMPESGGQIMVLTHTGRRSGKLYRQPLNYAITDGAVHCVAGFGSSSDWYKNILKNPRVEVWLPDGWWEGTARDVTDAPERLRLIRAVIRASGFAGRLAGMDAKSMKDAELDTLTRDYRLIRIERTAARTGGDGPGDLAWVWQAATVVLLGMVLCRRKKG
jgi:deazaflavin-dependent oxidoreductase (nitroreductase family)